MHKATPTMGCLIITLVVIFDACCESTHAESVHAAREPTNLDLCRILHF